jgi:hypothetical protein
MSAYPTQGKGHYSGDELRARLLMLFDLTETLKKVFAQDSKYPFQRLTLAQIKVEAVTGSKVAPTDPEKSLLDYLEQRIANGETLPAEEHAEYLWLLCKLKGDCREENNTRVKTPGNYPEKYKIFETNAQVPEKYRNDPRFENLAKDPAHGNQTKPATRAEAMAGLQAESQGLVKGPIERGPAEIEFYDGDGNPWDVKAPPSAKPGQRDFFNPSITGLAIQKELREKKLNENDQPGTYPNKNSGIPVKRRVILDSSYLKPDDHKSLWKWLTENLTEEELSRIVEVNTNID